MLVPFHKPTLSVLVYKNRYIYILLILFSPPGESSSSSTTATATPLCTRARQAQFQYPDCFLPELNSNLLLSKASFLLSHDAATGYITRDISKSGLTRRYTQTVTGNFYQQLDHGARALDLRPLLLRNGTIVFQHGLIRIDQVDFFTAMDQVKQWCAMDSSKQELVLLLPSHFAYESQTVVSFSSSRGVVDVDVDDDIVLLYDEMATYYNSRDSNGNEQMVDAVDQTITPQSLFEVLSSAFKTLGIPVYTCTDVYQWTVGDAKKAAALTTGGYAMALMNPSGSSCAKENWIANQIVTCYPNNKTACTTSNAPWQALQEYMLQSANNAPSDTGLGPPADLYNTPLFEIQALWQVDAHAVIAGIAHFSSILIDNRRSRINELVMRMVYDDDDNNNKASSFQTISLLAVDNVGLYGNALTSVLRNRCGQLADETLPCGTNLPPPRLRYAHVEPAQWIGMGILVYFVWFGYSVVYLKKPKLLYTAFARWRQQGNSNVVEDNNGSSRQEDLLDKRGRQQ